MICTNNLTGFLETTWQLYVEMAFYMLIGLVFVGILNEIVSRAFVARHTGGKGFIPVMKAALFGIPLPLCSCGVLPMTAFMNREGAGKGATASFLMSTPQTGIDSIIATYGLLGPVFAVFRPIAAFISAVFTGRVIDWFDKEEKPKVESPAEEKSAYRHDAPPEEEDENYACCSLDETLVKESSCCSGKDESSLEPKKEKSVSCCEKSGREAEDDYSEKESCCSSDPEPDTKENSLPKRSKRMYNYAFKKFLDDISEHFLFGILLAGLIAFFLPADLAERFNVSDGVLGMLLMIVIGLPMYICATSSIPIAVAFMLKGFSPGTAFVFLAVGPATNAASIAVISKVLGKRNTAIYIGMLSLTAVLAGLLLDFIFLSLGINAIELVTAEHSHGLFSDNFKLIGAIIFSGFFALSLYRVIFKKSNSKKI